VLNVLLVTWGSAGDVMPFIGIGSELRRRGHDVTLITNPAFAGQAAAAELPFAGAGMIEEYKTMMADGEVWKPRKFFRRALVHWSTAVEPFYARIAQSQRPGRTVLVAHVGVVAARVAQEKFDLPMASVYLQPALFPNSDGFPHAFAGWMTRFAGSRNRLTWYQVALLRRAQRYLRLARPLTQFRRSIDRFRATLQLPPIRTPFAGWVASPQRIIGGKRCSPGFPYIRR
jgi:rhamnosyltransferase subunit B